MHPPIPIQSIGTVAGTAIGGIMGSEIGAVPLRAMLLLTVAVNKFKIFQVGRSIVRGSMPVKTLHQPR